MDLNGSWRAIHADDDLRRDAIGFDVDDTTWSTLPVPGHWRSHPDFASDDGPVLVRRDYRLEAPPPGSRRWLTLHGIFYQADVWLDGAYLGDPEGYFTPHSFDITALSRIGEEHVVAIEVACPPQPGRRGRRNITGVFQQWDGIDRDWNPGGIWRGVDIVDTGPVRADRFRVLCRDADETRAHLLLRTELDSDAARRVVLRTSVAGEVVDEHERRLAAGSNDVGWSVDVARPSLWWPRALGDQPLTDVAVEVVCDGATSDRRTRRTGLRHVAWNDWTCSVNGERIFLKGANLLPTRAALGDVTVSEARRDVELAAEANLDALRVHGHVAHPAVYDAADELGILLLQDFPLVWGHAQAVRDRAVRQARAAVDELGHHPSIVQWNAHDDPVGATPPLPSRHGPGTRLRRLAAQQLPGWNKTVLDRWVKRAFERADPTRLVVPHSGVLPHFPLLDGTDSHLWVGWRHGEIGDLVRIARSVPRVVRFVSEFGAQSVPDDTPYIDPADWPHLDWDHLEQHHGLDRFLIEERVSPVGYATFDDWRRATQEHQADLLRHHIEVLRRLKYRPTGGFCLFSWNDPAPLVSCSVLDHERRPKPAYDAVRRACRDVIVVTDRLAPSLDVGARLVLDVHVVSDRRTPVGPAVVDVVATWTGGRRRWRFGGEIPADDCLRAGRVELEVPDAPGRFVIELSVTAPGVSADNRDETTIVAPVRP